MFRNKPSSLKHTWSNTQVVPLPNVSLLVAVVPHEDTRLCKNLAAQTPLTTYLNVYLSSKNPLDKSAFCNEGLVVKFMDLLRPSFFLVT